MYDAVVSELDQWVSVSGPVELLLFRLLPLALLWAPVALVHELGHASVALIAASGRVRVRVGRRPAWFRRSWGRLDVAFHPMPPRNGPAGYASAPLLYRPIAASLFCLAAPFANLVLAIALGPLLLSSTGHRHDVFAAAIGLSVLMAVATLVPRSSRGRSDGRRALDAIAELRRYGRNGRLGETGDLTDSYERFRALYFDSERAEHTAERLQLLAGPARAVGANDPIGTRHPLLKLAVAGWSWAAANGTHPERGRHASRALDLIRRTVDAGDFDDERCRDAVRFGMSLARAEQGGRGRPAG